MKDHKTWEFYNGQTTAIFDDLRDSEERCYRIYADSFGDKVHHIATGLTKENAELIVQAHNAGMLDPITDGEAERLLDDAKEYLQFETFDNQPTIHMLRLIAKDMQGNGTHQDVKRSRGNWLMRFVRALEEKR